MGTNQSRQEKEIIISQAGNSGGTTGLQQMKLNFWEIVGLLAIIVGLTILGYCMWRCNKKATRKQIRREITRSQELLEIRMSGKNSA